MCTFLWITGVYFTEMSTQISMTDSGTFPLKIGQNQQSFIHLKTEHLALNVGNVSVCGYAECQLKMAVGVYCLVLYSIYEYTPVVNVCRDTLIT